MSGGLKAPCSRVVIGVATRELPGDLKANLDHAREVLVGLRPRLEHLVGASTERGRLRLEFEWPIEEVPGEFLIRAVRELTDADTDRRLGALTADAHGYRMKGTA